MATHDTQPLVISHTPGALQRNWKVPAVYPLCPSTSVEAPLQTYFDALYVGDVAVSNIYAETVIDDVAMAPDSSSILVLGDHGDGSMKRWSLMRITFENGYFVHESHGTFFDREGAEKQFTLAQVLPWEGEESIDDYC
ncbi:hypothetical protein A6U84_25765 (plasmid) [Agrobacterium sp. 13-2099-1-2]|uniref:hypothetical protein n=1 Tax=Agrobacterium sp. 13-2099-1-2 TaxID=1841651 RepID=UPI00080FB304|nr:hypothetical protein [Agrobacterium sp. 13-2099-1-2]UZX45480.1 hypothetical protein A6U84_25765 [Agrobacterium sp. 13-2099-1-2]